MLLNITQGSAHFTTYVHVKHQRAKATGIYQCLATSQSEENFDLLSDEEELKDYLHTFPRTKVIEVWSTKNIQMTMKSENIKMYPSNAKTFDVFMSKHPSSSLETEAFSINKYCY